MSNETHSDEIWELRKKFEKDSGGRVDEVKPGSCVGEHGSMKTLPELKYSCPTCGRYMDKPCDHWKAWIANPQPTQPAETHSEKGLRGIVEKLREDARTFESPYWTHEPAEPDWDYVAKAFKEIADDIEAATPAVREPGADLPSWMTAHRMIDACKTCGGPMLWQNQQFRTLMCPNCVMERCEKAEASVRELRKSRPSSAGPAITEVQALIAKYEKWKRSVENCAGYEGHNSGDIANASDYITYSTMIEDLNALLSSSSAGPSITEAQAQDAYCDSFDTDAPAVAPAPDFKRLAKAINRFLAAPSSAGEAAPATQTNWKGVRWCDSIRAGMLAEEIALHFAHDCHDSMCGEDADESNCEMAWVESKIDDFLYAIGAVVPAPAATEKGAAESSYLTIVHKREDGTLWPAAYVDLEPTKFTEGQQIRVTVAATEK